MVNYDVCIRYYYDIYVNTEFFINKIKTNTNIVYLFQILNQYVTLMIEYYL